MDGLLLPADRRFGSHETSLGYSIRRSDGWRFSSIVLRRARAENGQIAARHTWCAGGYDPRRGYGTAFLLRTSADLC